MGVFHLFKILQVVPNRTNHHYCHLLSEYGCIFEDRYGGLGISQGIKNSAYECIRDCIGLNIYYTMLNGVSIQQQSDGKVSCFCQSFLENIKERPGFKCCKLIRKLFFKKLLFFVRYTIAFTDNLFNKTFSEAHFITDV